MGSLLLRRSRTQKVMVLDRAQKMRAQRALMGGKKSKEAKPVAAGSSKQTEPPAAGPAVEEACNAKARRKGGQGVGSFQNISKEVF